MDVYFYEAFEEEATSLKTLIGNQFTYGMTDKTLQETGHEIPPARLISIRTQSLIPTSWAANIDGVLSRSTGYDHLKRYLLTIEKKLPCGYLDEYATRAVAEHAILLTLSLMRRLPKQIAQFPRFERDGLTGNESKGKNLLVVGVGRIGSEIVELAKGLGMNVKGVDIVRRLSTLEYLEKEDGLRWADCIVCSMNLTSENQGYFSYELLKQTKPGTLFVNIARGEHSPLQDLCICLEEHHLGGIGLDVYEDEPEVAVALRTNTVTKSQNAQLLSRLLRNPNVLCTPHNAFNTLEAVQRKSQFSVNQILHFLKHRTFLWKL